MSDQATSEKPTRQQVAKHYLLLPDGTVTKDIEEATGIRYEDITSKEVFDFQLAGAEPGKPITMLALFGSKTKATNEASQYRQAVDRGDEVDVESQVVAIREAFAMIETGVWREKSEGGFARIDRAALAQAIIDVKQAANAPHEDEAFYTQKLTDDPKYLRLVRQVPEVNDRYNAIKNIQPAKKSVSDI